ncbi:MAG: bifunctional 23S rRNA (guanine(2069)-N(7))-methyltransferase RlmK/23S rRNA (guanine(2445)-N(2))-methyltransferase RlmL, partial [Candidatus Ornithospirochaeta sp.]
NQGDLIAEEARKAGAERVRVTPSGVDFEGSLETGYRFCFETRISSRLLMGLFVDDDIISDKELEEATAMLPWEEYIDPTKTLKVTCTTQNCRYITNSHYGALKVKDGIVERIREKFNGERPYIEIHEPDLTVHVHIEDTTVKWYVDFSGENLSMRGYRGEQTEALLKEHLAAALIGRSEWRKSVNDGNPLPFYDPFCGSGTIAVEAALMATDTAPGLLRNKPYPFESLPNFDKEAFDRVVEEAEERRRKAIDERDISIFASDISRTAVEISKAAALKAGVYDFISFSVQDFTKLEKPPVSKGCIVTDPPYGERMTVRDIDLLYENTGKVLQNVFKGWDATILTGNSELLSNIDMKPDRTNTLFNGGIMCQAAHYHIFTDEEREAMMQKALEKKKQRQAEPLTPGAEMAYNRLMKNLKEITPLMKEQGVECYRIYDADMPEYSASIDIYMGKWVVVSEYAAPDTIDPEDAKRRLGELVRATEKATGIDEDFIYVKERSRQKGKGQYTRLAANNKMMVARENGVRFLVNFTDYLDTGIFLDHRPVRMMIQEMAKDKRFLNLFCYTGTATLNAIKGGALSTVSVDASSTYLAWMEENLKLNGYSTVFGNLLYKSDVIDWLWDTYDKFDLIFCDPPTFSNSKDRRGSFDVQRDHVKLIDAAAMHLSPGGTLIFSNNYRKFKLDPEVMEKYVVEDITEKTIGDDFKRDMKIHHCYLIRKKIKVKISANHKPRRRS